MPIEFGPEPALHGFELAPFVLGYPLGPLAEINIKRALQTNADPTLFVTRPISGLLLTLALVSVAYYFWVGYRRVRPRPST